MICTNLRNFLQNPDRYTKINLDKNFIGDEGVAALAEVLKTNKIITKVRLSFNRISDKGAAALAETLKINECITELNLSDNYIRDKGAAVLAEALKINRSIAIISINDNLIGDEGAVVLAQALEINRSIAMVSLVGNKFGNEAAIAFANVLKINHFITVINLNDNHIGVEGSVAFIKILETNYSMAYIGLFGAYNIGDENEAVIDKLLARNKVILNTSEMLKSLVAMDTQEARLLALQKYALNENISLLEDFCNLSDAYKVFFKETGAYSDKILQEIRDFVSVNLCGGGSQDVEQVNEIEAMQLTGESLGSEYECKE